MSDTVLRQDFSELVPFALEWGLPTERERHLKRLRTTLEDAQAFYAAMFPRMEEVFQYFSGIPADDLDKLSPQDRRLFDLARAFIEVSHPIELNWGSTDLDDGLEYSRLEYLSPSKDR